MTKLAVISRILQTDVNRQTPASWPVRAQTAPMWEAAASMHAPKLKIPLKARMSSQQELQSGAGGGGLTIHSSRRRFAARFNSGVSRHMKNRGKRKALAGYVKRGKKLVSPMNALQNMKSYSYVNDLLPELLWLGLINDYSGYLKGRDVLECVVTVGKDWDLPIENFALQSAYISLSEEQKLQILDSWESAGLLDSIRSALSPLILLYDRCALRFIGPPAQAIPVDRLVERLERVVGSVADKYETPGIMLHGALLMNNLIAGRVHFASHIELPDFNAVVDRPDSEDARRAGSFIRASTMAQIGFMDPPKEWAQYFWDTSYDLVACDYLHDE